MHSFEMEDLIESLKKFIFNTNGPYEIIRFAIFKDADRVISLQLRIDLGDNTFLRWRYILTEINAWFTLLSHSSRILALEIAIHF